MRAVFGCMRFKSEISEFHKKEPVEQASAPEHRISVEERARKIDRAKGNSGTPSHNKNGKKMGKKI